MDVINILIERKEFFLKLMIEHLQISIIAIIIATIIGLTLGILISENKKIAPFILGMTNVIYTIPAISLFGFLIPFSGIGTTSAIIALSIYGILPILKATYVGINNIDPNIIEAAVGMGSTKKQIMFKIKLPLAFIVIFSGFRTMVIMTLALAGIASFIGSGGLGVAIYRGITTNNTPLTIAGSLSIAVLALFTDLLLGIFEKLYVQRKLSKKLIILPLIITIFLSSIIFLPKNEKEIKIATKPMSEQFILSEILKILIEEKTDLNVSITKGIGGGTSNIHPAMLKGEFDMYPEYTGTSWSFVLKNDLLSDSDEMYAQLKTQYEEKYNLAWTNLYGFNNTYGIAINKDYAQANNIQTISDLRNYSNNLIFGGEYDFFEREDGYNALISKYNLNFKSTLDLDIGLKYDAIKKKSIDVVNVFTTDGQLIDANLVVLKDDLNFFDSYFAGTIVSLKTLDTYPELNDVFKLMENLITNEEMAKMNYEVDVLNKEDYQVAKEFLQKKGLIK